MRAIYVDESMLSEGERRLLRQIRRQQEELRESIARRCDTHVDSLTAANRRYQEAYAAHVAAYRCYHEALLQLAEDPDDDEITALEKREKFERIETEYIDAGAALIAAERRCEWEIREAEKFAP